MTDPGKHLAERSARRTERLKAWKRPKQYAQRDDARASRIATWGRK